MMLQWSKEHLSRPADRRVASALSSGLYRCDWGLSMTNLPIGGRSTSNRASASGYTRRPLAERTPAAFLSYVHADDDHDGGAISALRQALEGEISAQTGRRDVQIFQDRDDIAWGDLWLDRIDQSLDAVALLMPVLTPRYLISDQCRREAFRFLDRESRLQQRDLILPIYWISSPALDDPELRAADELATELISRQYADWRELRFEGVSSPAGRRALAALATRIRYTLEGAAARSTAVDVLGDMRWPTRRQLEILTLLADGYGEGDIGAELGIGISTVRNHVRSALERAGLRRQDRATQILFAQLVLGRHPNARQVWERLRLRG